MYLSSRQTNRLLKGLILSLLCLSIFLFKTNQEVKGAPLDASLAIHSDIDFVTYGFSGNGTSSNPYIIENLNLSANLTYGIYINDTTKHFIIRNCNISHYDFGVYLYNVAAGTAVIEENTLHDVGRGIYNYYSDQPIIRRNTVLNYTIKAINTVESDYCLIANNTIRGLNLSHQYGIETRYGIESIVRDNYITDSGYGMSIMSNNSLIENNVINFGYVMESFLKICTYINNTVIDNDDGKSMNVNLGSTLINNTLIGCRLGVSSSYYDEVINFYDNTVNGKELKCVRDVDDWSIDEDYGQLILIKCNQIMFENLNNTPIEYHISSLYSNNISLDNCILQQGIEIDYCDVVNISNCTIFGKRGVDSFYSNQLEIKFSVIECDEFGILLSGGQEILIDNNTITGGSDSCISGYLKGSINVTRNTCSQAEYGIGLYGFEGSDVAEISENTCFNNDFGIDVSYSSLLIIQSNTCHNNTIAGLSVYGNDMVVTENNCYNNTEGIYLQCYYAEIKFNTLATNTICGIVSNYAILNEITQNYFIENGLDGTNQSVEMGSDASQIRNTWYNATEGVGNHYSDWKGYGYYKIGGNTAALDRYPMVIDTITDVDIDGLHDMWEELVGLDTSIDDSADDLDGDFLINSLEYAYRTNVQDNDTDDDTYSDYVEISNDSDPNNSTDIPNIVTTPTPTNNTSKTNSESIAVIGSSFTLIHIIITVIRRRKNRRFDS